MRTIKFLRQEYIVVDGIGIPEGAIDLEELSNDDLIELHNLLALNMERRFGGRVRRFKDRASGFRKIREKLIQWEGFDPEDD